MGYREELEQGVLDEVVEGASVYSRIQGGIVEEPRLYLSVELVLIERHGVEHHPAQRNAQEKHTPGR